MDEFGESKIDFDPTYKYITGSSNYNWESKPAWTDRILSNSLMRQTSYKRAEINLSDHKPVFATFETDVKIID